MFLIKVFGVWLTERARSTAMGADILPDIEPAEDYLLASELLVRHAEVPLREVGLFAGFGQSELEAIERNPTVAAAFVRPEDICCA